MNKKAFLILSIFLILIFSTYLYFDKTEEAFSLIITFLSIIIGFCISALSIISSSNFAKELYQIEDKSDNSKTLLHNLTNSFTNEIFCSLIAIILILFSYYLVDCEFDIYYFFNTSISIKTLIIGGVWYFTIISIINFIHLVILFKEYVIQSAKKTKNNID